MLKTTTVFHAPHSLEDVKRRASEMFWSITPGGLLSVALIAFLVACAPLAPRADAAAFEARDCVLGVAKADEVMNRESFRDPVDTLITSAIDNRHGNWLCPAQATSTGEHS